MGGHPPPLLLLLHWWCRLRTLPFVWARGFTPQTQKATRAIAVFIGDEVGAREVAQHGYVAAFAIAIVTVCASAKNVILVADGFDELQASEYRSLLLPQMFPSNFRMVLTVTTETWAHTLLKKRAEGFVTSPQDIVLIDVPTLGVGDQTEMILRYFHVASTRPDLLGSSQRASRPSFSGATVLQHEQVSGLTAPADTLTGGEGGGGGGGSFGGRRGPARHTGTIFEVKGCPRAEFNQMYVKRGMSSSWQIYMPLVTSVTGDSKCQIKCSNGVWELRDPTNKVIYVNDMGLDTPPQLGWRENKKDTVGQVQVAGPYVLCHNRPAYLPLFLHHAALEIEASAHEAGHLSEAAVATNTRHTIQSVALCGSPQSVLHLTLERLEVRYSGTTFLEALRKVLVHLSFARGGLSETDLQELSMTHAFGDGCAVLVFGILVGVGVGVGV
jgi:hypothetical protein